MSHPRYHPLRDVSQAPPSPPAATPVRPHLVEEAPAHAGTAAAAESRPPAADTLEPPTFLTADEAAAFLRTTRAAIYSMAERGRLPGVARLGRRLLVHRETLLRSLTEGRAPSPRGVRR